MSAAALLRGAPLDINASGLPSLVAMLERSARMYADRPAFHNLGVTLTFADLDRLSRHFAAYLASLGLTKGERIALMMPNLLQYPIALFGALRAGLTVVNTNPLYTPRELEHQLTDSGARAIVVLENFAHVFAKVHPTTSVEHVVTTGVGDLLPLARRAATRVVLRWVKRQVPAYDLPDACSFRHALELGRRLPLEPVPLGLEDLAFLQYTGGTTGVPKGAMLTHGNVLANLLQLSEFWKALIEPGREVMITPLPVYHVFCLTCNCLLFVHHGGLNVLITNPRDIRALISELATWRFTMISGVNTLYAALLRHESFAGLDFSALKIAVAGGMPLDPHVAEAWRARTGRPLIEGYGLTETSPVVACSPYDTPRLGYVGVPLPATEVSVRDGENEASFDEPGELCVRGPQVMRGYWNRPADTAAVFTADGWLRTGDIAILERDGFVRILDRKKDLIIVSGFKVFPNEVEGVVSEHSAVLECGCIGVPDARSGQAVKIFVVPRGVEQVSAEELRVYCRERLTSYKVPKHVEFVGSLPKTNIGKVLRRELAHTESAAAAQ